MSADFISENRLKFDEALEKNDFDSVKYYAPKVLAEFDEKIDNYRNKVYKASSIGEKELAEKHMNSMEMYIKHKTLFKQLCDDILETVSELGDSLVTSETAQDLNQPAIENKTSNEPIVKKQVYGQIAIGDCPACKQGFLTAIGERKGGFSGGKAVAGAVLAGPVGLAAGLLGKKKVTYQCNNCGYIVEK